MGFQGLPSEEKFGKVQVQAPVAPKHTSDGHEKCAFYPKTEEIAPDVHDVIFIDMECPHRTSAGGAFYSEDYVKELRRIGQQFLGQIDKLFLNHPNPSLVLPGIDEMRKTFE